MSLFGWQKRQGVQQRGGCICPACIWLAEKAGNAAKAGDVFVQPCIWLAEKAGNAAKAGMYPSSLYMAGGKGRMCNRGGKSPPLHAAYLCIAAIIALSVS